MVFCHEWRILNGNEVDLLNVGLRLAHCLEK